MAPTLAQARPVYRRLWDSMVVREATKPAADKVAHKIIAGRARYLDVQTRTGVPWWFVGLLHSRESSCNFSTYLGNGQPLARRTTIVPKGRGPFKSFEDGACDALALQGYVGEKDWSLETVLYRQEGFNGWGYIGKTNSPYVWAGSNQYVRGKYVADHVYDPNAVDQQIGVAAILARLAVLDASVAAALGMPGAVPVPLPPDVPPVEPRPAKPAVPGKTTIATTTVAAGAAATASGTSWVNVLAVVAAVLVVSVIASLVIAKLKERAE